MDARHVEANERDPRPPDARGVDGRRHPAHRLMRSPLRAEASLLVLEAAALTALIARMAQTRAWLERPLDDILVGASRASVVTVTVFGPVVPMAVVAVILLHIDRRSGWLLAMLGQGVLLAGCLALYPVDADAPGSPDGIGGRFLYPLMALGVLTTLTLNSRAVRQAVYQRTPDERDDLDEHLGAPMDSGR